VYQAVEVVDEGELFQMHEDTNVNCVVGANIQRYWHLQHNLHSCLHAFGIIRLRQRLPPLDTHQVMYEDTNVNCVVGANIQSVLEIILLRAQDAMEGVLAQAHSGYWHLQHNLHSCLHAFGIIRLRQRLPPLEVVDEGELFQMHEDTNVNCVVGANIQSVLEIILLRECHHSLAVFRLNSLALIYLLIF
jgi:hypothetical protein